MSNLPKYLNYILEAERRGYDIDPMTGNIVSPTGKIRVGKLYGTQRYASFTMTMVKAGKKVSVCFPFHKFAAYKYFGRAAFDLEVRHLNGNSLDNTKANIALGTRSENAHDKPAHIRSRAAKIARAAQGYSGNRQKLTYEDAQYIKRVKLSERALAVKYNVSSSCIRRIKKGKVACYE